MTKQVWGFITARTIPVLVLVAISAAAVSVAFVGLALADGATPSLIHACVDKHGNPRIVESDSDCKSNESALDWGSHGPQGVPGPPGQSVPANVLLTSSIPDCSVTTVEVACASKDLPPGTWLVSYRAVWQLNALTFPNTTCALFADGVPIDTDSGGTVSGGLVVTMTGIASSTSTQTIEVRCLQTRAGTNVLILQRLTALEANATEW